MNYIIFDLEWNQADRKSAENPKIPFEIVEIGAIKLNSNFEKIGEFSRLIRPTVYHTMHSITQDIVHISMSELRREQTFCPVMRHFLKWCGEDPVFGTWGPLDLFELQRNMEYYGFDPLSDRPIAFLDIQKLFALSYEAPEEKKKRRALNSAVEFLGLEDDIPFHRAFGDAYYTAKVLQQIAKEPFADRILQKVSFDLYHLPSDKKQEIRITFDSYSKYITREFPSKQLAMGDKEVTSVKCYVCGHNCRKKIKWFSPNGKHYYSISHCGRHGFLKGKIRIKKTDNDQVYIIKTLKLVSEEQALSVKEKQDHARELRRQHRQAKSARAKEQKEQ